MKLISLIAILVVVWALAGCQPSQGDVYEPTLAPSPAPTLAPSPAPTQSPPRVSPSIEIPPPI